MNPTQAEPVLVKAPVPGCKLQVGEAVLVLGTVPGDRSFDERFVGQRGVVTGLLFDDLSRQWPADPLVVVEVSGLGQEYFFVDELCPAPAPSA